MNYPVNTALQLRAVLKSLRKSRGLTQVQLGAKLSLSQKRIAGIEKNPHVTTFDQISRIVGLLGARVVIEDLNASDKTPATSQRSKW